MRSKIGGVVLALVNSAFCGRGAAAKKTQVARGNVCENEGLIAFEARLFHHIDAALSSSTGTLTLC
jgi:hypothetical protein